MQVNLQELPAASLKRGPDRSEIMCRQNSGIILNCFSEMTVVVTPNYNFVDCVTVRTAGVIQMQCNMSFEIPATLDVYEEKQ
jgi:hypothetical protein